MKVAEKIKNLFGSQRYVKLFAIFFIALFVSFFSASTNADATITFNETFIMEFSNEPTAPDGVVTYAEVELTGKADTGEVWFSVNALTMSEGGPFVEGPNFGIQKFGFNSLLDLDKNQFALPTDWKLGLDENLSMFGTFEFVPTGKGNSRLDPLNFHITGLASSEVTLANFTELNSEGWMHQAHIAGFTNIKDENGNLLNPDFTSFQVAGIGNKPGNGPSVPELPNQLWIPLIVLLLIGSAVLNKRLKVTGGSK